MDVQKNLDDNDMCYACGKRNDKGMHLEFAYDEGKKQLETTFTPSDAYQGWKGVVHGGVITTLADEAMAKLAQLMGYRVLTAALDMRFKGVARTGVPLHVKADLTKLTKKIIFARAVVNGEDGTVIAEAQSKLMVF